MKAALSRAFGRVGDLVQDPNPIVVKELRAIFRTKLFIRFLYLATGIVGILVLSVGAISASGNTPPAEVGNIVFQLFFGTALTVVAMVAPAYAATTLTSEKETRTYESLLLTGMKPWRIVRGKFIASFSSILLVLVAFGPTVGIAFLFGGISLWNVLIGYYALALVLAAAVALGVAISARLGSTRISIVLALIVFAPISFFGTIFLWAAGEGAQREWGTGMSGPFWFTEALATRMGEPDTFALLGLLPIYVFGMTVWFLLASAVAGVRPPAEDRSTPFKVWSIVAVLGTLGILVGLMTLIDSARDSGQAGVVFVVGTHFALLFYAILFINEPPLPPRLVELRRESYSPFKRMLLGLGPGAAPTARFAALLIVLGSFGASAVVSVMRHVMYPEYHQHDRFDAAQMCLAIGGAAICIFAVFFGSWLRATLRSGVASRVLTLAVLGGMSILPFLAALIVDPDSLDRLDQDVPFVARFAPVTYLIHAVALSEGDMRPWQVVEVAVPAVSYGLVAAFFWVLLEARVRRVRAAVAEQRERQHQRAELRAAQFEMRRSSVPPGELMPLHPEAGDTPDPDDLAAMLGDGEEPGTGEKRDGDDLLQFRNSGSGAGAGEPEAGAGAGAGAGEPEAGAGAGSGAGAGAGEPEAGSGAGAGAGSGEPEAGAGAGAGSGAGAETGAGAGAGAGSGSGAGDSDEAGASDDEEREP